MVSKPSPIAKRRSAPGGRARPIRSLPHSRTKLLSTSCDHRQILVRIALLGSTSVILSVHRGSRASGHKYVGKIGRHTRDTSGHSRHTSKQENSIKKIKKRAQTKAHRPSQPASPLGKRRAQRARLDEEGEAYYDWRLSPRLPSPFRSPAVPGGVVGTDAALSGTAC